MSIEPDGDGAAALEALRGEDGKFRIELDDLTFGQLDDAERVKKAGAGRMTSLAWAYLHGIDSRIKVHHVRRLKMREVDMISAEASAGEDDEDETEPDPDEVFTNDSESPTPGAD